MIKDFLLCEDHVIDGISLKIVRDDIFPFIGGGSKARKAVEYESFLKANGYNAVVTCGGIQSNHNRAIALMAARNSWKCHLCIQGSVERFEQEKGNALLDRLSGAECELIQPEETSIAMDRAMEQYIIDGLKPYYVTGGGHDLSGGIAFVKAVQRLKEIATERGYKPDYIFHASGTGSTQAGILVGLELVGWSDVKVVGISVARQYERGKKVISDFANMLGDYYNQHIQYEDRVIFNTDYLYGGYEKFIPEMQTYLESVMRKTGLVFDTTYSGKGFWGMMDILSKGQLRNKNILFWHTGGLMNIQK
jgi:1-aminocyclopropane-1-carboxylate deaminase